MTLLNSSNDSKSFVGLFLMAFLEFSIYRMMSFVSRYSFTSSFSIFVVVQSLSHVQLFAIAWIAACQTSLSLTVSQRLLKLMSIDSGCHPTISSSVIPFSSCLQSFPASGSFPVSQLFASGGQNIGASLLLLLLLSFFSRV